MRPTKSIIKDLLCETRALTVVELLVAMILLLIVLTIAFTFFGYGINAFNTGEKRTLVQINSRLASRIITDELRYAESVVIYNTLPAHISGVKAIYLNDNGAIMLRDETGSERKLSGDFSDEVTFTGLLFDINVDSSYKSLSFSITADREGEQEYTLSSEVAPLNQKGRISYDIEGQTGSILTYILIPPEEDAILNAYPRQIFEQIGPVDFNLLLVGDSFHGLSVEDISLGGDFDNTFSISNLEIIDDKEVNISINGSFSEGIGSITIDGDALLNSSSLSVEIFIIPDYVFITDDVLPDGMVGAEYSFSLTAAGGLLPYTFTFDQTDFAKPTWLNLEPDGSLWGTPDADTEITIKISVSDSSVPEQIDAKEFTFTIDPKRYNLSMYAGLGGTTDPPVGDVRLYEPNEVVTILATPHTGYVFVNWVGDVANHMENPTTVEMTEDMLVTANFASYLVRLKDVAEGSFVLDGNGNLYIKLSGISDRVLSYSAEGLAGLFDSFDSNLMPGKEEIQDWSSDQLRMEPDGKEYWTKTYTDTKLNKVYSVTSTGLIVDVNINAKSAYLRRVVEFSGAFVDETNRDGSLSNPYLIVNP